MQELIDLIDNLDLHRDYLKNTTEVRLAKLIILDFFLKSEHETINLDVLYAILGEKIDYPKSICQAFYVLDISIEQQGYMKKLISLYESQGYEIKPVSDYIRTHSSQIVCLSRLSKLGVYS